MTCFVASMVLLVGAESPSGLCCPDPKQELIMRIMTRIAVIALLVSLLGGCFLTKLVTVPMRVVGAVVSIVPVAGNTGNTVIQTAADTVDEIPI